MMIMVVIVVVIFVVGFILITVVTVVVILMRIPCTMVVADLENVDMILNNNDDGIDGSHGTNRPGLAKEVLQTVYC